MQAKGNETNRGFSRCGSGSYIDSGSMHGIVSGLFSSGRFARDSPFGSQAGNAGRACCIRHTNSLKHLATSDSLTRLAIRVAAYASKAKSSAILRPFRNPQHSSGLIPLQFWHQTKIGLCWPSLALLVSVTSFSQRHGVCLSPQRKQSVTL